MRVLLVAAAHKRHFFETLIKGFTKITAEVVPDNLAYNGLFPSDRLTQKVRKFGADLVYTDSVYYPVLLARAAGVPAVIRLRGNWWMEFADSFAEANPSKKVTMLPGYLFGSMSFRKCSGVVPICRWLANEVRARTGKRTDVVYQGVDPKRFKPKGLDENVVIVQENNIKRKVEGLLAFRSVIESMPAVTFRIAGGGKYTQMVENHFKGLPNVELLGKVNYPDGVRKVFASAGVYVLASGLDCCPTTVLEASLSGLPVVVSKVGGVPEFVTQKTGYVVANGDTKTWVERIGELLDNKRKARAMGTAGRKFVTENFSWSDVSKVTERILLSYG